MQHMPSIKRKSILLVFLSLLALPGNVFSAAPSPQDLVAGVNDLRQNEGLPALTVDNALMYAAQTQANYLASTYGANFPTWDEGHIGAGGTSARDRALGRVLPREMAMSISS
jgi:hypothetical protein